MQLSKKAHLLTLAIFLVAPCNSLNANGSGITYGLAALFFSACTRLKIYSVPFISAALTLNLIGSGIASTLQDIFYPNKKDNNGDCFAEKPYLTCLGIFAITGAIAYTYQNYLQDQAPIVPKIYFSMIGFYTLFFLFHNVKNKFICPPTG